MTDADRIAQLEAELAEARREKHSWADKAAQLRRDYEFAWKRGDEAMRETGVIRAALGVSGDFALDALVIAVRQMRAENAAQERTQADAAAVRLTIEAFARTISTIQEIAPNFVRALRSIQEGTAGRGLIERAKLNDLRRRCAVALFDRGHIECVHEDGCPEDDTCDCPLMPLVHAVLNDDAMVDVADAEQALAWCAKHDDACTTSDCVCAPIDEKGGA